MAPVTRSMTLRYTQAQRSTDRAQRAQLGNDAILPPETDSDSDLEHLTPTASTFSEDNAAGIEALFPSPTTSISSEGSADGIHRLCSSRSTSVPTEHDTDEIDGLFSCSEGSADEVDNLFLTIYIRVRLTRQGHDNDTLANSNSVGLSPVQGGLKWSLITLAILALAFFTLSQAPRGPIAVPGDTASQFVGLMKASDDLYTQQMNAADLVHHILDRCSEATYNTHARVNWGWLHRFSINEDELAVLLEELEHTIFVARRYAADYRSGLGARGQMYDQKFLIVRLKKFEIDDSVLTNRIPLLLPQSLDEAIMARLRQFNDRQMRRLVADRNRLNQTITSFWNVTRVAEGIRALTASSDPRSARAVTYLLDRHFWDDQARWESMAVDPLPREIVDYSVSSTPASTSELQPLGIPPFLDMLMSIQHLMEDGLLESNALISKLSILDDLFLATERGNHSRRDTKMDEQLPFIDWTDLCGCDRDVKCKHSKKTSYPKPQKSNHSRFNQIGPLSLGRLIRYIDCYHRKFAAALEEFWGWRESRTQDSGGRPKSVSRGKGKVD